MSLGGWIFAATYDRSIARIEQEGLREQRRSLLASAHGRVLEIGGGTGANLPFYGSAVESLTMTEPEPSMVKRLSKRVRAQTRPTTVLRAPAEDLPFGDGTFDTVVSTLVLCTVDDQPRVLRELRRVLRADGQLLFIEHVRAEDERRARTQDRINGLNRMLAHGCNCNRRTLKCLQSEGYDITRVERTSLKRAPVFARPLVVGVAVPTSAVRVANRALAGTESS